jgi:DNA helicase-2/ATP-dependent DNA helicase PcrA
MDFERIFVLQEGLGKATAKKFEEISNKRKCSIVDSLNYVNELKLNLTKNSEITKLSQILYNFSKNPISLFLDDFRYRNILLNKYRDDRERLQDKLENIQVLIDLFGERGNTKEEVNLFLDELIELEKKDKTKDKVILSTIHSAKGLEWEHVFLISCNEKTLPYYTQELEPIKRDSELRLFYVAISRAKKSLVISHYNQNGWGKENERSSFIDIIDE